MPRKAKRETVRIRDRIRELRRVKASDLESHPENWRTHPDSQQAALRAVLAQVGWADAVLAYEREPGRLVLIDGHARKDEAGDDEIPVLVLDVDEQEARLILATHDPLVSEAGADAELLDALLQQVETADRDLALLLDALTESTLRDDTGGADQESPAKPMPAQMELQPYEHYDYIVLLFRNSHDFMKALDLFEIETVAAPKRTGSKRIGIGRAIDGKKALARIANNPVDHAEPPANEVVR